MHHPVGEPDLVDEVGCTVDGFFLRIIDIIKCMKYVFDYPVVAIKGEGPLEHNSSTPHHPSF
jgi:hypothetical protein